MTDSTTAGAAVEEGTYGRAQRVPRDLYAAAKPACLDVWLVTHPLAHPDWDQYLVSVATFADMPGVDPLPAEETAGATHQLIVGALDPNEGPYTVDDIIGAPVLMPVDIIERFVATDDQAVELTGLCAQALVNGLLWPETTTTNDSVERRWHQAVTDTLRHIQTGDCCNDHHHPLQVGP